MKHIVHLTVNLINGKIFIGTHATPEPEEFDDYLGDGVYANSVNTFMNPATAFQFAVKKYGTKNFRRVTLYVYDTAQEALDKYNELVTKEFILMPNNYNMIIDGVAIDYENTPIYQFNDDGKLVKKWESITEAADFFNISPVSLNACTDYKEKCCKFYWNKTDSIIMDESYKSAIRKRIYKYDSKSNKCLVMFDSLERACEHEDIDVKTLLDAIKYSSNINGFYYSDRLLDEIVIRPKKALKHTNYYLYKYPEGDFVAEFPYGKEIMKVIDCHSWTKIFNAINERHGIYRNWRILTEYHGESAADLPGLPKSREVAIYNLDATLVGVYPNAQQAAKSVGASLGSVNRVLRGLAHTASDFVFKYQ